MERYNKKSDINFTIPEPFNFLKKNYHQKKLTKIQEILEERQKTENEIFNHQFRANELNSENEKLKKENDKKDDVIKELGEYYELCQKNHINKLSHSKNKKKRKTKKKKC